MAKVMDSEFVANFMALFIVMLIFGCGLSVFVSIGFVWAVDHLGLWELEFTWENILAVGILFMTIMVLKGTMSATTKG